ncbi:MbnP family protein [Wenyingzhuangia sp. IMCC45574]
MNHLLKRALLAFLAIAIISCNEDDNNISNEGTHVSAVVKFDHSLALGDHFTLKDKNNVDQNIELTKFKYLISNIIVIDTDNQQVQIPNNVGAQLIDLANTDDSNMVKVYLTNIPDANYKSISFGIGVSKEVANGSTHDQTRLMDLAEHDMQWAWNPNSYIFSKIEGANLDTSTTSPTNLLIHLGDKGDSFSGYRTVNLDFPENLTVKSNLSPSMHVTVAVEELFTPTTAEHTAVAFDAVGGHGASSEAAGNYADNFKTIFEVHHLHIEAAINLEDVAQHDHEDNDSSGHGHTHSH